MKRLICGLILAFAACQKTETETDLSPEQKLAANGRKVFLANCVACHSADPSRDGTVGPALKGTSFEILKEKLLHSRYPEGYKGKRPISGTMPKFPFDDDAIRSLEAFLK